MNHLQLTVVALLVFTTFGTAFGLSFGLTDSDKYNLQLHKDTNGFSPNFLKLPIVKITCISAFYDDVILGYCSQELGTLHELHFSLKVNN